MKAEAERLSQSEFQRIAEAAERVFPRVLPAHWRCVERYPNASTWESARGLRVIGEVEQIDGKLWAHVSVSRADRLPDWADLRAVKNLFIGIERRAIQVLPPESEYFNHHPFCLHLYSPLDDGVLPDFRLGNGTI